MLVVCTRWSHNSWLGVKNHLWLKCFPNVLWNETLCMIISQINMRDSRSAAQMCWSRPRRPRHFTCKKVISVGFCCLMTRGFMGRPRRQRLFLQRDSVPVRHTESLPLTLCRPSALRITSIGMFDPDWLTDAPSLVKLFCAAFDFMRHFLPQWIFSYTRSGAVLAGSYCSSLKKVRTKKGGEEIKSCT